MSEVFFLYYQTSIYSLIHISCNFSFNSKSTTKSPHSSKNIKLMKSIPLTFNKMNNNLQWNSCTVIHIKLWITNIKTKKNWITKLTPKFNVNSQNSRCKLTKLKEKNNINNAEMVIKWNEKMKVMLMFNKEIRKLWSWLDLEGEN